MLPICVRPERVWPKLSSIQAIRANLVYIVSLVFLNLAQCLYKFSAIVVLHFATAKLVQYAKKGFFNKDFNDNVYKSKFIISSAFLCCLITKLGL